MNSSTGTGYNVGAGNEWKVESRAKSDTQNQRQSYQPARFIWPGIKPGSCRWLDSVDLKISFAACSFLPSLLLPYFCRTSWRWWRWSFVFCSWFHQMRPRQAEIIKKHSSTDSLIYIYIKYKYIYFLAHGKSAKRKCEEMKFEPAA